MRASNKLTRIKAVVALVAVLASSGVASAKKPVPGLPAQLSADRTSVDLTIAVQCDPATTLNSQGTLSVHIFQSVGRLINIGSANYNVTCTGIETSQPVTVEAVDGLSFQPGPATLIYRFTTTDSVTLIDTVQEKGARLNLHP